MPAAKSVTPKAKSNQRETPKFGESSAKSVTQFQNALKVFPITQQRQMMGCPAATVNGKMFACLFNDKIILRLSADDCAKLFALGGKAFEPMPGRSMKNWAALPRRVRNSARELNAWMDKAMEWTKGMPKKNDK